jgi:hypothetical protein
VVLVPKKLAPNFCSDIADHCQAQESADLLKWKKSSVVEAHTLWKLGQVFNNGEG